MKLLLTIPLLLDVAFAQTTPNPQPTLPTRLQGIGIDQRLGAQVPLNVPFLDESGRTVTLRSIAPGRPVLLALVYYQCTILCNQILNGVVRGLRPLSLTPGGDFDIVAISINPAEDPPLAAAKREHYTESYSKWAGTRGWHFLTGTESSIRAVADAVGFKYLYDPKTKLFLHASGVMVLTPEGRVARYFYGVEYEPKDLKLGLIGASGNRIGSPVDQILLFCYHYDPLEGKYSAPVLNLLKAGAAATLLLLSTALVLLWRSDLRRRPRRSGVETRHP
jgi:protein SCO1